VCDGAASAAAVGKPRKPKKPKKEAGVPFVEDATNKPQQLGLVSVIKTMLERSAKRREAIELQAQLEKFATTGGREGHAQPARNMLGA
jgi:hypothetical protein